MLWREWFQREIIVLLLIVAIHSFICSMPSFFFKLTTRSFQWEDNVRFSKLNSSSIGAYSGLYGDNSIILQPKEFRYPIHFFEVWILQLSIIKTILLVWISRSFWSHSIYFSINRIKLSELFWDSKFETNQSPLFVIAAIREIDPTKTELLTTHSIPLLVNE